jgi:hypothetical protein
LKFLATGTFTMMLAACYGTIQVMYGVPYALRGMVKARKAGTDIPVAGIKVSYLLFQGAAPESGDWSEIDLTDEEGTLAYVIQAEPDDGLLIKLEDLDGELNEGSFAETILTVDEHLEVVELMPVTALSRKP